MKDDNTSTRAVALMQQALELMRLAEQAPESPVNTFVTGKRRRALRRDAERLRQGKAEPRYKNLHTAEELADLYERTVQRDECIERTAREMKQIGREIDRIRAEHPAELQKAMEALVLEVARSAEEQGPGSEAERRLRRVLYLASLGHERHAQRRRQKAAAPPLLSLVPDPSVQARYEQSAAQVLTSPPSPDDAVILIPPQDRDAGRGRLFIRIGTGQAAWTGSFERGHAQASTVAMLPDGKHLFVSAAGAGYVINAESRTLVETTGMQITGTMSDAPLSLYVVNHDGLSLEAFGRSGRLWKTAPIGSGGFRKIALGHDTLVGEARYPTRTGWARFSVQLATGEVEIDATEGGTE